MLAALWPTPSSSRAFRYRLIDDSDGLVDLVLECLHRPEIALSEPVLVVHVEDEDEVLHAWVVVRVDVLHLPLLRAVSGCVPSLLVDDVDPGRFFGHQCCQLVGSVMQVLSDFVDQVEVLLL